MRSRNQRALDVGAAIKKEDEKDLSIQTKIVFHQNPARPFVFQSTRPSPYAPQAFIQWKKARAFYYKVASSKCRKSFSTKCFLGHPNVFKNYVNVRLRTNQSKDPATVPKSVSESLKEPVTTSKSIAESVKDPVTTSKSISEGMKKPVTSSKSFSEGMKDHVTTSKSISEGMKKPVTSSKSFSEGIKDPVTSSKFFSEGMKDPMTTSKSISEGMKEPVTNCLSGSTSEFFKNAYVAMLNKAIDFLDSYLVCHDVILNFSTPSTLHELVEIFKRKLATFLNILTESMVTNTSQKKENLQLYDSLIRESSLVMREKHLDREKSFHDMKVEFICSFIRLNGAKVLLPEELKALCSLVTQELKGDLKEATNLCSI